MAMIDLTHAQGALSSGAPNEVASVRRRDWLAVAPSHKHVPARLAPIA